jgi:dedicator of cytokinesis protein 3
MDIAANLNVANASGTSAESTFHRKAKSVASMSTLKEEDEELATTRSLKLMPPPDIIAGSRGLPLYHNSIRSTSPADSRVIKPLPPRPSLKSGDDTASGVEQPIVDEIASALREWHMLMFQYLAKRDYKLFHVVREHIEALHLGRRQLLAQTLSAEETNNLRRECVTRLVCANISQGLDIIVRHPSWGGLVTVDVGADVENRNWVSAIRMYTMQTALAYLDVPHDTGRLHLSDTSSSGPSINLVHSAFPDVLVTHTRSRSRSQGRLNSFDARNSKSTAKFYHVYLDLRSKGHSLSLRNSVLF